MHAWKRRLVYIPGVGTKPVDIPRNLGDNYLSPEHYTLSYIPEESSVRVETRVEEGRNDETYNLKNLLIRVENSLTESQRSQQESSYGFGSRRTPISSQNWGNKMRKVKAAQRIPGSPNIRIITLPVQSPMERQATKMIPQKDTEYVLHLKPFTSKDFHFIRPSNFIQPEFGNMASPEMRDYFNNLANSNLMQREYQRISEDRKANPSLYNDEVFGQEIARNPESGGEVYDTDSEIEENE